MVDKIRLHYLDWLRVLSMSTVFLYHSNRFFNAGDWNVKNAQLSQTSSIFENGISIWMMPLLFVLSGAAVFYSLKARTRSEFVKERALRLLVPLIILGIVIFGPFQVYIERLTHGDFTGNSGPSTDSMRGSLTTCGCPPFASQAACLSCSTGEGSGDLGLQPP